MEDHKGILIVDKEKGWTSHDVVAKVRRIFGIKKVGHAGTLDPLATGVLVLLLGKATKLSNTFLNDDKGYRTTIHLGEKTSTGDLEGDIIYSSDIIPEDEKIKEVINTFHGEITQIPPMTSAKSVNGKRLYKLARAGKVVKRDPITVFIKEIIVEKINAPFVTIKVVCTKGTYIRQLGEDIGEKLGCGAHLSDLRRIFSGKFSIDNAFTISEILKMDEEKINESILQI